ncbi:MAG: hypothetical protein AAF633_15970 [Chloroflexota bacterium]
MARVASSPGLNWKTVRTLLRLRGRLTLRQFTRETGRVVGAIIGILVFLPLVIGGAIGSAIGYRQLELVWSSLILSGVLVSLWLFWLFFPIVFAPLNESIDIERLMIYPVAPREVIVASLLSPIFDYPTYLVLPLFIAVLVGFGLSPALPIIVIGLLLAFAHMILIGQLVVTIAGGLLQTRRFRDLIVVGGALLGSSCYFINLAVQRLFESTTLTPERLQSLNIPIYARWLPTGAVAQAITDALSGAWGSALLWLAYSSVLLILIAAVWFRLMVRLTTGQGFLIGGSPPKKEEETSVKVESTRASPFINLLRQLPPDLAALTEKELRSMWRIPQRRVALAQGIILPAFMFGGFVYSGGSSDSFAIPTWVGLILPPYALFLFWVMTQNMLAWEGRGLGMLLLTPVPRERIFLAKGIALLLTTGSMYLLFALVMVIVEPGWLSIAGLVTGLGIGIAALAVTSVTSVLFPMPINLEAKRTSSPFQTRGGCLTTLGSIFLTPPALLIVSLPAVLLLLAAWNFELPALGFFAAAIAPVYGWILFWYGSRWAGHLLLTREPKVIKALRVSEEEQ